MLSKSALDDSAALDYKAQSQRHNNVESGYQKNWSKQCHLQLDRKSQGSNRNLAFRNCTFSKPKMAITEILRYTSNAAVNDNTIRESIEALKESKRARHESLGVGITDKTAVQITAEWDDDHQIHPGWSHIADNVKEYLGEPKHVFHATLNEPFFGSDGPGTSNVIEFAANYFPRSKFTPEFKKQIEADFLKFDKICSPGLRGSAGLSYGWVAEEAGHEGIEEEKAVCFLIVRGWESFEHFQKGTKSKEFEEAAPILFAWEAPHEIVSVRIHT